VTPSLRVALVAGGLTQGGAEKQLVYMAHALARHDVGVRVYSLTRGDFYEAVLARLALPPVWIGRRAHPLVRTLALARSLRAFRPHIVQAGHFFTNLHVTLAARLVGAADAGTALADASLYERLNRVRGRYAFLPAGRLSLHGYEDPVDAYQLLRP